MGEDVTLINPAYETAMELRGLLKEKAWTAARQEKERNISLRQRHGRAL